MSHLAYIHMGTHMGMLLAAYVTYKFAYAAAFEEDDEFYVDEDGKIREKISEEEALAAQREALENARKAM